MQDRKGAKLAAAHRQAGRGRDREPEVGNGDGEGREGGGTEGVVRWQRLGEVIAG